MKTLIVEPIIQNIDFKDPKFFKTNFRTMQKRVHEKINSTPKEELELMVEEIFTSLLSKDFDLIKRKSLISNSIKRKELEQDDSQVSILFGLFDKVFETSPWLPIIILTKVNLFKIQRNLGLPIQFFEGLDSIPKNEIRATQALHAFSETYECLYKFYLKAIDDAFRIYKGKKKISFNTQYGGLVKSLLDILPIEFQEIVFEDAAFIRNAIQHSSWDYDNENDEIIFWDNKLGRKDSICVDCIIHFAEEMYVLSELLFTNILRYYQLQLFADPVIAKAIELSTNLFKRKESNCISKTEEKRIEELIKQSTNSLKEINFKAKENGM